MKRGQSLVELLIGIALAGIFVIGAATIVAPSLQENKQVIQIQAQTELTNELLSNIRAFAQGNWTTVLLLTTSTVNLTSPTYYHLNATTSPFSAVTGTESFGVLGITYTRFFIVSDAYRDTSGNATTTSGTCSGSSPCYDPSTKFITVNTSGNVLSSSSRATTLTAYVTRNGSGLFSQSDWSGGSGQNGSITITNNLFSTAVNVTYSNAGALTLPSVGGSVCTQ